MINTLRRAAKLAPLAFGRRHTRNCGTGTFASTEPRRSATPSNPHAAPIIWRIAPACRRAAKPRCNACRRTCRAFRPDARARCARWKRRPRRRPQAGRAAAAPKAAAPAAATASRRRKPPSPKAAAAAPAGQPTSAQISAIRSACRSDYPKVCAGVPTGGAPALQCLEKNKAKLSAGCEKAVAAASGGAHRRPRPARPRPQRRAAAAAAPAAPAVIVLRPMRPREELFVLRSACGADVRSICGGVAPGGGRIVQCLATKAATLSPACKDVLSQFAAR